MRWFKHMTSSYDDQKIAAVLDELGMEGYGFWWRILEVVARQLDENSEPACEYSAKKWGEFFGFSAKKFEKFVRIFQKNGIFLVEFPENPEKFSQNNGKISKNTIRITIPNLLKYRDEYTERKAKKSGHNRNNIGTNSGPHARALTETDTDTDIKNPPISPASGGGIDAPQKFEIQNAAAGGTGKKLEPARIDPELKADSGKPEGKGARQRESYPADFCRFWEKYPKKVGKDQAARIWKRRKRDLPDINELCAVLERQCHCEQWRRDGGQYIPNPATWLNQGRWQDVTEPSCETWTPKPANW